MKASIIETISPTAPILLAITSLLQSAAKFLNTLLMLVTCTERLSASLRPAPSITGIRPDTVIRLSPKK